MCISGESISNGGIPEVPDVVLPQMFGLGHSLDWAQDLPGRGEWCGSTAPYWRAQALPTLWPGSGVLPE